MECTGTRLEALIGIVDMPIQDRYETDRSKKMVSRAIFGVEYLILATKTKTVRKMLFFWGVWVAVLGL